MTLNTMNFIQEQAENASLQDECKTKEQELRTVTLLQLTITIYFRKYLKFIGKIFQFL